MTLTLPSLSNFRDVAGLPAGDSQTRPHVLYRSDSLASLTDSDAHTLARGPVGFVVDMRSTSETVAMPGWPTDAPHPRLVPMPMLDGSMQSLAELPSLEAIYRDLLAGAGEQFARVAALVADGPEGVLVHCSAGKDRTGVSVALILLAVGVNRDAVLDDYAQSSVNLDGEWHARMLTGMAHMGVEHTPQMDALMIGTDPTGLDRVIREVEISYGSAMGYLRAHGLTEAQAGSLRERLVG